MLHRRSAVAYRFGSRWGRERPGSRSPFCQCCEKLLWRSALRVNDTRSTGINRFADQVEGSFERFGVELDHDVAGSNSESSAVRHPVREQPAL